jgi:hypothetical protein
LRWEPARQAQYGRFVFYRSDGSERYVVMQLDQAAAVVQDFGIATY